MDILDTPGDWVELIVSAAFVFGLVIVLHNTILKDSQAQLIGVGVLGAIFWYNVFDYDLILGYLVGSILLIIYGVVQINRFKEDKEIEKKYSAMMLFAFLLRLVWITKIICYFK